MFLANQGFHIFRWLFDFEQFGVVEKVERIGRVRKHGSVATVLVVGLFIVKIAAVRANLRGQRGASETNDDEEATEDTTTTTTRR